MKCSNLILFFFFFDELKTRSLFSLILPSLTTKMETLRLPLVGDFVFVSGKGGTGKGGTGRGDTEKGDTEKDAPEVEKKYVVTHASDDGYHILPSNPPFSQESDPKDNTSMIKYQFLSQKWVVHGEENIYNVRIEMNPSIRSEHKLLDVNDTKSDILKGMKEGDYEKVDQAIREHQDYATLQLITQVSPHEDPIYEMLIRAEENGEMNDIIGALEWLKRNYFVDYFELLMEAILNGRNDIIEWILSQNVSLPLMGTFDSDEAKEYVDERVIAEDDIVMMRLLSQFEGFFDAINKELSKNDQDMVSFTEENYPESTQVLEFLKSVPTKAVQTKHLK